MRRPADTDGRWVRDESLHAVPMDGEFVMMGLEQGEYYALKDVAALLWRHLDQPRDVDELSVLVASEYDVSAEACRADVVAFIEQLRAKGMVRPAP